MTTDTTHFVGRIVVTRVTKTEVPATSDYGTKTPARTERDTVEELDVTVKAGDLEALTRKLINATDLLEAAGASNDH